jgi:hypothetical protein
VRIGRRHRLLGAFFAIAGHLVWLGLGVSFWWALVTVLCH